jgi:hypothetical protein
MRLFEFVMPGLVPAIHVFGDIRKKGMDGRDKPGHDGTRERNEAESVIASEAKQSSLYNSGSLRRLRSSR